MEEKQYTIIYQDTRKIRFIELYFYNCGSVVLSRPGQELKVKKAERDYLLKLKNGKKPIFAEKIKEVATNGLG